MCHIFFLLLLNSEFLYESARTVSGTRWYLLSSDVFLINAVFIAQYCGHKRIKIVYYWIAGGFYCRLQIRWWQLLVCDVVY